MVTRPCPLIPMPYTPDPYAILYAQSALIYLRPLRFQC